VERETFCLKLWRQKYNFKVGCKPAGRNASEP